MFELTRAHKNIMIQMPDHEYLGYFKSAV